MDDSIIASICKFGGYVFKPVTLGELKRSGVADFNFNEISTDDTDPFYIIGFAANVLTCDIEVPPMLIPIDRFPNPLPPPYLYLTPTSFVSIYGNGDYSSLSIRKDNIRFVARHLLRHTTQLLEGLIKVAGVQFHFEKFTDSDTVLRCLGQFPLSQCFPKPEQPVEKLRETPVEAPKKVSRGNVRLSREEVMDLLKTERDCVRRADSCDRNCEKCPLVRDTADLLAMYDAVIKYYGNHVLQNQKGKYVRMADGSRKWLLNEDAEKLLEIPVKDRK